MFGKKQPRIYLDYASATSVLPEAITVTAEAMQLQGNPGALHQEGVLVDELLEESREIIARELGCKAREIIFTSGGTESNNLAILGLARKRIIAQSSLVDTHWIVSSIEHTSVLECFGEVERLGGTVSFVDPDARGIITPEAVANLLRPETVFVSVGWANSEIGIVQPIAQIAKVLRQYERNHAIEIIFHTDAGQAPLYKASTVHALGVDMVSLDSGKLYGPRGIGALWITNRVELSKIMFGGKQERNLRAGTENSALAAGFAKALSLVGVERGSEAARIELLRGNFAGKIAAQFPTSINNTDLKHSLPHILNISIPNINSEYLVLALDHHGVALSTKSACHEGEESRSHVVEALVNARNVSHTEALVSDRNASHTGALAEAWRAQNTLRFSFGRDTKAADLDRVVLILTSLVEQFQNQKSVEKS